MWLLKLHFSISVLCLITFIGFREVCRETVRNNGWKPKEGAKKNVFWYLIFFVPIMNVLAVIIEFMMISTKQDDFEKFCEEQKKSAEENRNE